MARKNIDPKSFLFEKVYVGEKELTNEIEDLISRLKIDPNAVDEEASEHSALFAYWAVMAEEASARERWLKRDRDILMAEIEQDVRRDLAGQKPKPTEATIAAEVALDARVQKATEDWLDAQRDAGILSAIRQSLAHRREMIAELMRDRRQEWSASERSV